MITFCLLVALWKLLADGYTPINAEAVSSNTANTSTANLGTSGYAETGGSTEGMTTADKSDPAKKMAPAFSTPSYTQSKEPHALSSPMAKTRTRRNTEFLPSDLSTAPKEAGQTSTTEYETSERSQEHSAGLDSGHAAILKLTTQRPTQTSALPATLGKKVTLTATIGMTTTSMRMTRAKTGATSDPNQKLSPFSQSISSSSRDKTTATNKTQVKSTAGPTTFSTQKTITNKVLTTVKVIETTAASTNIATTKQTPNAIQENSSGGAGTAVAVVMGGAIVTMIVAIMFIMWRKKRRQERNKYNTTWAGPTPFLDGEIQSNIPLGEDDDGSKRQSHKRISVPNFLSGLSSKRESLLKDADDQVPMEKLGQGSTFSRPQDNVSSPSNGSVLSDEAQPLSAMPTPGPESTPPDTSTMGEDNLGQDPVEGEMPPPPTTETHPDPPAPILDVDLEPPPGQEALPPPPADGPTVPPPPPLPHSTD